MVFVVCLLIAMVYDGAGEGLWSRGWDPSSMIYDGAGGLFIVSNDHLRHVTRDNKGGVNLWSEGWSPSSMVYDGAGGLFMLSGTAPHVNLRHITPGNKEGDGEGYWSGDWDATPYMVSDGAGGVFIVSRGTLRHVTRDNKGGKIWSGGWKPSSMVYDGADGVFMVSNGHLRHVTPDNKDGSLWSGGWSPTSMVYDGAGGVFIVSNDHLRHVTRDNKGGVNLWSEGWSPSSMVYDGAGGLFMLSGTAPHVNLRHITPGNKGGEGEGYWSGDWDATPDMVSDGAGGVFIVSRETLRHVTPGNKGGAGEGDQIQLFASEKASPAPETSDKLGMGIVVFFCAVVGGVVSAGVLLVFLRRQGGEVAPYLAM